MVKDYEGAVEHIESRATLIKTRWWAAPQRADQVEVRGRVTLAVFRAAKEHGIDLAYPTQVLLIHDQTEETDGDRRRQRDGWPPGREPLRPRPIGETLRRAEG